MGKTIAYTAGYSLDAVAPDGTDIRSLLVGSDTTTGYGHPAFTADSRAIVYGALGVIGAIDVDGTNNQTLLTGIVGSFEYPNMAFSPDYTQIVTGIFCNQESPLALLIFPTPPCREKHARAAASSSTSVRPRRSTWGRTIRRGGRRGSSPTGRTQTCT